MQTDNSTAHGILCATCKQHRRKAIDMMLYWVRDRAQQGQHKIGWGPSAQNLGDYFTKHHTPAHHKGIMSMYVHIDNSPEYIPAARKKTLQGCVASALSPGKPAGHHTNSAMTGKPCTATKWLCQAWTLFRDPHLASLKSHKLS
jgi:hypothetical protein